MEQTEHGGANAQALARSGNKKEGSPHSSRQTICVIPRFVNTSACEASCVPPTYNSEGNISFGYIWMAWSRFCSIRSSEFRGVGWDMNGCAHRKQRRDGRKTREPSVSAPALAQLTATTRRGLSCGGGARSPTATHSGRPCEGTHVARKKCRQRRLELRDALCMVLLRNGLKRRPVQAAIRNDDDLLATPRAFILGPGGAGGNGNKTQRSRRGQALRCRPLQL